MRELFAFLACIAVLFVAFKTEIPAKAVAAVEAQLDAAGATGCTHTPEQSHG